MDWRTNIARDPDSDESPRTVAAQEVGGRLVAESLGESGVDELRAVDADLAESIAGDDTAVQQFGQQIREHADTEAVDTLLERRLAAQDKGRDPTFADLLDAQKVDTVQTLDNQQLRRAAQHAISE